MTLQDADTRLRAVVDLAFGGVHHVGKITKYEDGSPPMWSFTVSEGLSTFDASALTRLVVAAHDQCVRVSIYPGGAGWQLCLASPPDDGDGDHDREEDRLADDHMKRSAPLRRVTGLSRSTTRLRPRSKRVAKLYREV